MKKIILILLSLSALVLLSACGGVKYEFIDGFLYANGKEATGTFEFILNGFEPSQQDVNVLNGELVH